MWSFLLACSVQTFIGSSGKGAVSGGVYQDDGSPVVGATVVIGDGSVVTDSSGRFAREGLTVGDVAVSVNVAGLSPGRRTVQVDEDATASVTFSLVRRTHTTLPDAVAGGTLATADGLQMVFPAGALVDGAGAPIAGVVDVDYAMFTDRLSLANAPGPLRAVYDDGTTSPLVSDGMVDVVLTQAGADVHLAKSVAVSFPVIGNPTPRGGTFGSYWFDTTRGLWVPEGGSRRVGDRFEIEADHFSTWNCDAPAAESACVEMVLETTQGPLANANVLVWLSDGISMWEQTNASGYLTFLTQPSVTATIAVAWDAEGRYRLETADAIWSMGPYVLPGPGESCLSLGAVGPGGADLDGDGEAIQPWGNDCFDEDPSTTAPCPDAAPLDTGWDSSSVGAY
jgi:hypothetical protein